MLHHLQMRHFFGCLLLACLAGCASFRGAPEPPVPLNAELASLSAVFSQEKTMRDLQTYNAAADENLRRRIRDEHAFARMYMIDLRYRDFEVALSQEARNSSFFVTLVSLGLTGAASLISVSSTQAILAASDTALKGASESFSRDVLVERTVQVLTNQMRAERSRIRTGILQGLGRSTTEYPFLLAIAQVDEYFSAGTVPGAISALSTTVGAETAMRRNVESEAVGRFTRTAFVDGALTQRVSAWLRSDEVGNSQKLDRWCAANRLTPTCVSVWSDEDFNRSALQKMIIDLEIP